MIDKHMEEQASLHVLGALTEAEAREFKKKMQADPELQEFVSRLSVATGAVAGASPLAQPPPQLREKILAQIEPRQKIVTLPDRKPGLFSWLPWVLTAGAAAVCLLFFAQNVQLRSNVGEEARQIEDLNQLAQSLESTTNNLQQNLAALEETNRLANVRIAMLDSLVSDAPKAVAVSLWDGTKQDGVFVAQNLKALPADRDYELWVIGDNGKPVASGVFHGDQSGTARLNFKPAAFIRAAAEFAVTEEVKGGVSSPTIKNMVLAGK
jgi:anti-sigma-K factor RskA